MKVLALYLPQYHSIPENDCWWGKGYTEWTAVKNAKPLFKGHYQPKKPLSNNYYDLSDESAKTWQWQADLAKKYNVFGFCIYHYWFGKKMLLQKPMEILLSHKEIDTHYCICWANETWTRTWYGKETEVLIKQEYGGMEEWKRHYDYLSLFFKDKRYIAIDGCPVLCIYRPADIPDFESMVDYWNSLAMKDGFCGLKIIISKNGVGNPKSDLKCYGEYYFEPSYSIKNGLSLFEKTSYNGRVFANHLINRVFKKEKLERMISIKRFYRRVVRNYKKNKNNDATIKHFPGVFPRWDNCPRRGYKGTAFYGDNPSVFESFLRKLFAESRNEDFCFVNAWNEWGEGCFLEPDEKNGYEYLEVIKEVSEEFDK